MYSFFYSNSRQIFKLFKLLKTYPLSISELTKSNTDRHKKYAIIETCMFLMLWNTFVLPFIVVVIPIYLGVDPLFDLFSTYDYSPRNMSIMSARYGFFILIVLDTMKAVSGFFIIGLMVVCSMNDIITDLTTSRKNGRGMLQRFREIKLYMKILTWNKYTNQNFCSFSVPPLIFFGISVIVLTYYGTIRMYGKVPWLVYITNPIIGTLATCFVVILIPQAANVVEFSETFLRKRMNLGNISKFERKTWKALRPLGIQVGAFGAVRKNLKPLAIKYIAENTITLLLTV